MNTENITLFLSILGAVLSTFLALLTVIKFRKDVSIALVVSGNVPEPFEHLQVEIANNHSRPVTLKLITIGIGTSRVGQTILLRLHHKDHFPKLNESEVLTKKVDRTRLIRAVKEKNILQKEFQQLWVNVKTSHGKSFSQPVHIEPGIIIEDHYIKAANFIATDVFLGFEQMDSKTYVVGAYK